MHVVLQIRAVGVRTLNGIGEVECAGAADAARRRMASRPGEASYGKASSDGMSQDRARQGRRGSVATLPRRTCCPRYAVIRCSSAERSRATAIHIVFSNRFGANLCDFYAHCTRLLARDYATIAAKLCPTTFGASASLVCLLIIRQAQVDTSLTRCLRRARPCCQRRALCRHGPTMEC